MMTPLLLVGWLRAESPGMEIMKGDEKCVKAGEKPHGVRSLTDVHVAAGWGVFLNECWVCFNNKEVTAQVFQP